MRVKRGFTARRRRKSILKLAKGFRGRSGNTIRQARARVEKALCYSYRDRRAKKRDFRKLWIIRIGAAARLNGLSYSKLISGLTKADVQLDRKVLADIGIRDPETFTAITAIAKEA